MTGAVGGRFLFVMTSQHVCNLLEIGIGKCPQILGNFRIIEFEFRFLLLVCVGRTDFSIFVTLDDVLNFNYTKKEKFLEIA